MLCGDEQLQTTTEVLLIVRQRGVTGVCVSYVTDTQNSVQMYRLHSVIRLKLFYLAAIQT